MNVRNIAALGALTVIATTGVIVLPTIAADAATKGKVSFLIAEGGSGSSNSQTAVLHGAINAGGKDISKDNTNYDTLYLGGGTLRVIHPNKVAKFNYKPNAKTCFFSFTGKGSYTLGHGTGKYKGISGSGNYTIHGVGIASKKKDGSCNFQGNGGSFAGYVTGSGPVSLP